MEHIVSTSSLIGRSLATVETFTWKLPALLENGNISGFLYLKTRRIGTSKSLEERINHCFEQLPDRVKRETYAQIKAFRTKAKFPMGQHMPVKINIITPEHFGKPGPLVLI